MVILSKVKIRNLIIVLIFIGLSNSSESNNILKQDEISVEYMYLYDFNGDTLFISFYEFTDIRKNDNRIGLVITLPIANNTIKLDFIIAYSFLYVYRKDYLYRIGILHPSINEYSYDIYEGTARGDMAILSIVPGVLIRKLQIGLGPSFRIHVWKMNGTLAHDYPTSPENNSIEDHKARFINTDYSLLHFRCNMKIKRFGFGVSSDILQNKHGVQISFVLKRGLLFN